MNIDNMNLAQVVERLAAIDTEVRASQDATQVDALATEKGELLTRKTELEALETRKQTALDLTAGGGHVIETRGGKPADPEDKYSTLEYRKAFMAAVLRGTPIPVEYRLDAFTAVADAAATIPTTIMTEIIKEMKVYGQLYARVRKTNIPGGVQVPILTLKPTASRISEASPSSRGKLTTNTYITFSYLGLECKIATSLLASAVTLPMFEQQIVPLIAEAMVKAQEIEIVTGNGTTQMLGVTIDTRVPAGNKITLAAADFTKWEGWKKNVFAKIPLAYRAGGIFIMGAGTFDGYIDGMVDANGQPIGRVNYGITESPQYRFGGREVMEVEEDVLASYDSASTGDIVAIYMNPQDYCINSNMQMAMYRWLDHDLNQWVDKALLFNDGQLLDAAGVFLIKKGA